MRKLFLLLSISIFTLNITISQSDDLPKKYQSLLWEISGNGLTKSSFLYGTMHVSNRVAFNLSDTFFTAIEHCDIVALETNMEGWMKNFSDLQSARDNVPFTSASHRRSSLYQSAFNLDIPQDSDIEYLLQSTPSIINHMLYRSNQRESDFQEDNFLDVFLFQTGKKLNKKIVGLEDFSESMMLANESKLANPIINEETTEAEDEEIELILDKILDGDSFREVMESAYRKGDLDLLDTLQKLHSPFDNYIDKMLYVRNQIMVDNLDSIIQKETVFAGVGAAHLGGDMGMIEMLRSLGYTLTAIPFENKNGIKTKAKIDEMRFPVEFKKQQAHDGLFTVNVPGKLYDYSDYGSYRSYLHNDLANGSYYYIQRMHHFGAFIQEDTSRTLHVIDSMLFENVPGKQIKKSYITSNTGYPGIDLLQKTRRGDLQRYQIFVTPDEVLVFKMSGMQEYVTNGKEADIFFNSIAFKPRETKTLQLVKNEALGYELSLPNNYINYHNDYSLSVQKNFLIGEDTRNNTQYLFIASNYPDPYNIEEDSFELNMFTDRLALELDGKILARKDIMKKSRLGQNVTIQLAAKDTLTLFTEIYSYGSMYYLAACLTSDSTIANGYFKSIQLSERRLNQDELRTYIDTTMHFSVDLPHIENDMLAVVLHELELESSEHYGRRQSLKSIEEDAFSRKIKSKQFVNHTNGDRVVVYHSQPSKYFHKTNIDSIWQESLDNYSKWSLTVHDITYNNTPTTNAVSFYLRDTNATKSIRVKKIHQCGTIHTLRAVVDSTKSYSAFINNFYDSFTLLDTCVGNDLFTEQLNTYFFAQLYHEDTIKKEQALNAISNLRSNIKDEHLDTLTNTILNPEFLELKSSYQDKLLKAFGKLTATVAHNNIEKIYNHYSDYSKIQLTLLRVLANYKTAESTELYLKLLKGDIPVSSRDADIKKIFTPYHDTLLLANQLFPRLFSLSQYPEYKPHVFKLMTALKEQNILRAKDYKSFKNNINELALYDLKKYFSNHKNDKKGEPGSQTYKYNYRSQESSKNTFYTSLSDQQKELYHYSALLAPFAKDKRTKLFFDKTLNLTKNEKVKIMTYTHLAQHEHSVPDTTWSYFANNLNTHFHLFKLLNYLDRLDLCPIQDEQEPLVRAALFGAKKDIELDSIELYKTLSFTVNERTEKAYVYKFKEHESNIWKLSYSGLHNDTSPINQNPNITLYEFAYNSEEEMMEKLDLIAQKIRIDNRTRASIRDFEKDDE